jgi:hypothetical protein
MLEKAYMINEKNPSSKTTFLFNPNELNFEKTNTYAQKEEPELPSSNLQFIKSGLRTLTMDLFFDTYEDHDGVTASTDVRTLTDKITGWESISSRGNASGKGLMDVDSDLHAPPVCLFVWGSFTFRCIIAKAVTKFTMFLPDGVPVRATLQITLIEHKDIEIPTRDTALQSIDRIKIWQVKDGDSLWLIAAQEYGDPELWRVIAKANGISNPRLLKSGMELVIPATEIIG